MQKDSPQNLLFLPTHHEIQKKQIDQIIKIVNSY